MADKERAYFNLGISKNQDQTQKNYFSMFPEEVLASVLDAFVINKPMEGKVGGDGFWVYQSGDDLFVALFDCMGHGHLASIMTRVYTQLLQKVIEEDGIRDPGTILRYLHHKIDARFKEKENLQIGPAADIALVKISMGIRKIEYAGAKVDLIQIENGEFKEIKANRFQVGNHFDHDHNYDTISVELKDKSICNFYMSSDGFKDLMGGDGGKKLGKRGIQKILRESHGMPMTKQKDFILEEAKKWQGSNMALDDMLIIGFAV
ncbi:MAG: SpoIIE family protein phosphatase [Cyclobacteriaceae bacterium]